MMVQLARFSASITGAQLHDLLTRNSVPKTVDAGITIDLHPVHSAIENLPVEKGALAPSTDVKLAPVVHATLRSLPRRLALDNRFWQWLTSVEFKQYVLARWAPNVDLGADESLSPSQTAHFLGNPGLNGFARNALARLYWAAEAMSDAETYDLTKKLFTKQDLVVGLLEREFGLIPQVIRTCTRELADLSEDERRSRLTRLSLRASTVQLEGATEDDVSRLLK